MPGFYPLMALNTTTVFGGAAVVGLITAGWDFIKANVQRAQSMFFAKGEFTGRAASALSYWLRNDPSVKKSKLSPVRFILARAYFRSSRRYKTIALEVPTDMLQVYTWRRRPLVVEAENSDDPYSTVIRVTAIRLLGVSLRDVMAQALDHYQKEVIDAQSQSRYSVRYYAGAGSVHKTTGVRNDRGSLTISTGMDTAHSCVRQYGGVPVGCDMADISESPVSHGDDLLEHLYYPDSCNRVIQRCIRWADSRDWYADRGILWRLGVLLSGRPGTGKSSFAKAVGQRLDLPVCVFDLASMSNSDFREKWDEAMEHAPCIILVEDVDAVFHGRENVLKELGGGLSFDTLLNATSGVSVAEGVLLIMTTNIRDSIDPALVRPGRIDESVHLGDIDEEGKQAMARRVLGSWDDHKDHLRIEDDVTPAEFEERCINRAIALHYGDPVPVLKKSVDRERGKARLGPS